MKLLTKVAAAVAVAGSFAAPAFAAVDLGAGTLNGLTSAGGCNNSVLSPDATQCFGVVAGNNLGSSSPGEAAVANFINLTWGAAGASAASPFTVNSPVDAGGAAGFQISLGGSFTGDLVIALKQANGFSLYFWDNAVNVSTVSFFDNDGFGGNGNLGISHYTVYGVPAIPEPQTYALMLAGLAAVGFMARRRRQG